MDGSEHASEIVPGAAISHFPEMHCFQVHKTLHHSVEHVLTACLGALKLKVDFVGGLQTHAGCSDTVLLCPLFHPWLLCQTSVLGDSHTQVQIE